MPINQFVAEAMTIFHPLITITIYKRDRIRVEKEERTKWRILYTIRNYS